MTLHRLLGLILPRALLVGFQLLLQLLTLLLGLLLLLLLKAGFLLLSAIVHMILQLLLRPVGGILHRRPRFCRRQRQRCEQ